jgi:hypothetical protein
MSNQTIDEILAGEYKGGFVVKDVLQDFVDNHNPLRQMAIIGGGGKRPTHAKNPGQAYNYCLKRNQVIKQSARQRPLIRLMDKDMNFVGRIAAEKSVNWEELMYAGGTAKITLKRNNWLADWIVKEVNIQEDLHIIIDPRPTKRSWRTRWGGKVTEIHIKRTSEGIHEIDLEIISNWEHWRHILFGANPVLLPEFQFPKVFIFPANTRTCVTYTAILNLARQYEPFLAIPTNLLNPVHWLSTELVNLNPLSWPVQMAFVNPVIDQSRFTFLCARWTDAQTLTDPLLKDAGCFIKPYVFLTEDEDTPHVELADLIGQQLARPTRNCIVLAVLDKSGVTGPTGTLVDGIVNLFAATADDFITELVFPVDADYDGVTDPLFRKWLLVAPEKPKIIFRDGHYSGIIEADRVIHKAKARTIMIGGKSPAWVNQAITFGIRYGLSQLAQVINYGLGAYEEYGAEGLDNVYQGQFDDTVLAFQRWTDPRRVIQNGAAAFLEHMEQGSGTAYTVSGTVDIRAGLWKTRPYIATQVGIINGHPWFVFDDFELGDRLGFELAEIIYVDQCSGIKGSYDVSTPLTYQLSIGTASDQEDPVARALRSVQAAWSVLGMVMGSGGSTF